MKVELIPPLTPVKGNLKLGGSKSISNRVLILNHIFNLSSAPLNLSRADDTLLLQNALRIISKHSGGVIDIGHAGTDLRFLTALLSVTPGEWMVTGSSRLKERPVAPLVNALVSLGADITYSEKENYAPLTIRGKKLKGGRVDLEGSVSSQFISALLLISPVLQNGLELYITGRQVSKPYINMTIQLLRRFGVKVATTGNTMYVQPPTITSPVSNIEIESDWSSASYWYSLCALSPGSIIVLKNFSKSGLQADSVLPQIYNNLGVSTIHCESELQLTHTGKVDHNLVYDFTDCPDIALTVSVTCAALGINAELKGLSTLKLKETDRISAVSVELSKFGITCATTESSIIISGTFNKTENLTIETYDDHRMAMSFAPLALCCKSLTVANSEVVSKSYPEFWDHLKSVGFTVHSQT